jgi:hypothetical protein
MDFNSDHAWRDCIKLPPQTHSPGVDYSPLMVESKEEALMKE